MVDTSAEMFKLRRHYPSDPDRLPRPIFRQVEAIERRTDLTLAALAPIEDLAAGEPPSAADAPSAWRCWADAGSGGSDSGIAGT